MVRTRTVRRAVSRRSQQNDYSDSDENEDERNVNQERAPEGDGDPEDQGGPGEESDASDEDSDDKEGEDIPPIVGALTPGQAMTGVLDYAGNKAHAYLFKNATRKLEEELF